MAQAAAASAGVQHALNGLPPEGQALKRHILQQLLGCAPASLSATEVGAGGPKRTDASVRYALRALERVGVVLRTHPGTGQNDVIRFRLTPGQDEVVRDFLADEPTRNQQVPTSALPALPRYQRVLKIFYDQPAKAFTVLTLCDKVRRKEPTVRRSIQELHEAGYLIRALPDVHNPGRPQFHYRLNPDATTYAFALVHGTTW